MTTLICDCNKTMPLDGPALRRVLGPEAGAGLETVHSTLCRREAGAFQRAAKSGERRWSSPAPRRSGSSSS